MFSKRGFSKFVAILARNFRLLLTILFSNWLITSLLVHGLFLPHLKILNFKFLSPFAYFESRERTLEWSHSLYFIMWSTPPPTPERGLIRCFARVRIVCGLVCAYYNSGNRRKHRVVYGLISLVFWFVYITSDLEHFLV